MESALQAIVWPTALQHFGTAAAVLLCRLCCCTANGNGAEAIAHPLDCEGCSSQLAYAIPVLDRKRDSTPNYGCMWVVERSLSELRPGFFRDSTTNSITTVVFSTDVSSCLDTRLHARSLCVVQDFSARASYVCMTLYLHAPHDHKPNQPSTSIYNTISAF